MGIRAARNANLIDPVPAAVRKRYFDFQTVTTDARDRIWRRSPLRFPRGRSDVRFYVKDTAISKSSCITISFRLA